MRIAILSVTNEGTVLARRLADSLKGDIDIFARSGYNPVNACEYENFGQLVAKLFHQYDGLIFIMSVSMTVRAIAPHTRDKYFDPAVITVDESGSFAISLLSGHLGNANALTRRVGEALGAQSVITSAIDVLQRPAIDLFAIKINANPEPFENIRSVNAAITDCRKVSFFIDPTLPDSAAYIDAAEEMDIYLLDVKHLADTSLYDTAVVVTDKDLYMVKPHVFLRPPTLAVGLECKRGTSSTDILAAISEACKKIGRSKKSIASIYSSSIYEEEIGLLAAGQDVPIRFIDAVSLQELGDSCEAAALSAENASKILGKVVHDNVKVAIAEIGCEREQS